MDRKRMAELSGVPGLVEHVEMLEAADETEISIRKFPEVTQVTGFVPPAQDLERTLKDIPFPALTTNVDRAAFKLGNLGVLTLDAQSAAWKIYLTPQATDAQVNAAIEMARQVLIPANQRAKADWLSGYRPQQPMESVNQSDRITKILAAKFRHGGYDEMMKTAYKIEAGILLPGLKDVWEWLVDALHNVSKHPDVKLTKNQLATLMMYRDDLRRDR